MAGKTGYRTRAQEDLMAYLKATPGAHHTAAELREHFREAGAPIGTATIYRRLEKFVDEGSIQKYFIGNGESACDVYTDHSGECGTHFHCKCERCGCLIHLDCEELREIRSHLKEHHGFEWNAGKTVFYGLCDKCRQA